MRVIGFIGMTKHTVSQCSVNGSRLKVSSQYGRTTRYLSLHFDEVYGLLTCKHLRAANHGCDRVQKVELRFGKYFIRQIVRERFGDVI